MSAMPEALTQRQVMAVFDDLADRRDLGFNYFLNDCDVRSHLMRRLLEEAGLAPRLAWAVETDAYLRYTSPNGIGVEWCYHVAVALPVVQDDGAVDHMVIDPSMYDGPVSLAEWKDKMGAGPGYAGVTAYDATKTDTLLLPDAAQSVLRRMARMDDVDAEMMCLVTLENTKNDVRFLTRVVNASPLRQSLAAQSGSAPSREGNGWISESLHAERKARMQETPPEPQRKHPAKGPRAAAKGHALSAKKGFRS